ncbi:MAG: bifunctional serine/threonine-protein kinase/formylglycine-generating enzyme family protein [Hyphomicrobiaceae bacterium]|nr:bifunctional serine/threonine-protein kinase/formylglycine-generating enzyme family protein [Hyphomicrobiaceae bacterium]
MVNEPDHTTRTPTAHGYSALTSGTRLGDRFTIESVIAAGGFGITYLGRHEALQRECAIKEHFPRQFAYRDGPTSEIRTTDPATFEWARERFIDEARTLALCDHPNVVRVIDVLAANGTAYMVLAYEDGQSLEAWLDSLGRRPSQAEIDRLLLPMLDALAYLHGRGILHRDIKPANIMVRRDGAPCLIDFGAARQAIAGRSQLTGIVTPGFSPPEQHDPSGRGQREASDIYALSATLYRAVTGRTPPSGALRGAHDELLPVAEAIAAEGARDYRPAFLAAIDRALRVRIAERPQSVAEWRAMLVDEASSGPRPAPGPTRTSQLPTEKAPGPVIGPPVSPPGKRQRGWLPWAVGGAVVVAGGAALAWHFWPPTGSGSSREINRDIIVAARPGAPVATSLESSAEQARLAEAEKARAAAQADEDRKRAEAEARRKAEAEARAKAEAEARRQDPIAALVPGSGKSARDRLKDGSECAFCPEMVVVPAGTFTMGSSDGDADATPTRQVTIRQPFAVGKFEVTFAEWDACVAGGGCTHKPGDEGWGRGTRPVINVSWNDAKLYVGWLAERTGKAYRLLTEAEWEYAARAGTTTRYFWGDQFSNARANNDKGRTVEVGQYGANAWGLHDMHGNVWEWVEDCYADSYKAAPTDSSFVASSNCVSRVVRGGSWSNVPLLLRSANRDHGRPVNPNGYLGFRLARTLPR